MCLCLLEAIMRLHGKFFSFVSFSSIWFRCFHYTSLPQQLFTISLSSFIYLFICCLNMWLSSKPRIKFKTKCTRKHIYLQITNENTQTHIKCIILISVTPTTATITILKFVICHFSIVIHSALWMEWKLFTTLKGNNIECNWNTKKMKWKLIKM